VEPGSFSPIDVMNATTVSSGPIHPCSRSRRAPASAQADDGSGNRPSARAASSWAAMMASSGTATAVPLVARIASSAWIVLTSVSIEIATVGPVGTGGT
jgi:hypothetical protein